MFARRLNMPPPRQLPWPLKPLESAQTSLTYDRHGRMVMRIAHDLVRNVTPRDVAWWFGNIGGDIEIEGRRLSRYLAWHPLDHIHWELVGPAPQGGAGSGARFRIVEAFGRNPDYYIDVIEHVICLDETGFTGISYKFGRPVSRLKHDFTAVDGGTRYDSTLTVGIDTPILAKPVNGMVHRMLFTEAKGRAWLKHNVEEVGLLEHMIPRLRAPTDRA